MQTATSRPTGINPVLTEQEQAPIVDEQGINKTSPRYIFFAGDLVSPLIKRKSQVLSWGGETTELDYKTLYTTRNVIFRNKITPMLQGVRWENSDLVPENPAGVLQMRDFGASNGLPNLQYGFASYPGTEVQSLLSRKGVYGIVELEALRGWSYTRVKEYGIQEHFFPEWQLFATGRKRMPITLAWTRQQIEDGIERAGDDEILLKVGRDMLKSVDAFYYWAMDRLKEETVKVKSPPNPVTQFTFSYTDLAEQLFEILEINRDDYLKAAPTPQVSPSVNVEIVDKFAELFAQNQQLMAAVLAKLQPETAKEVGSANGEVKTDIPVAPPIEKPVAEEIPVTNDAEARAAKRAARAASLAEELL